jgi:hypothetical protein
VGLYEENVERLLGAANATVSPFLIYHATSTNILEAMQVNGGNALGPLFMIVQFTASWDGEVIERSFEELIADIDALAESRGEVEEWAYLHELCGEDAGCVCRFTGRRTGQD